MFGIGIGEALTATKGIIGQIFGSAEGREQAAHTENMAARGQFAAEFRENRTWWDSFIDGLNRLPRPIAALGTLWVLFVWPLVDMDSFIEWTMAISVVPEGPWFMFSAVASFYFAGRMQVKSQSFKMTEGQRATAQRIADRQDAMEDEEFSKAMADPTPLSNSVIAEWNRRRK